MFHCDDNYTDNCAPAQLSTVYLYHQIGFWRVMGKITVCPMSVVGDCLGVES